MKIKSVNRGCSPVVMDDVFIIRGNVVSFSILLFCNIELYPCFRSFSWKDGDKDCTNGHDEANCTTTSTEPNSKTDNIMPTCHDWMFHCHNDRCVPNWWKCDGKKISGFIWISMNKNLNYFFDKVSMTAVIIRMKMVVKQ